MENKTHPQPTFAENKWLRLGFSVTLAIILAFILLLIPITARTTSLSQGLDLRLPFGAEIVYATGGLTITKTASPTPTVNQGSLLTYTLTVRNNTGFNLTDMVVTDTVPANTTCNNVPPPPPGWFTNGTSGCQTNNEARWLLPPGFGDFLANGATVDLIYVVSVAQPRPDLSQITNAALSYKVSAISPTTFVDLGAANINTTVFAPAWQIDKTVVPTPTAQPGDTLTYTLTVTNIGHLDTSGFYTITDQVPASTNYVAGSASPVATFDGVSLTWVLSTPVTINQAITFSYQVTVTQPLTDKVKIVNQTYNVTGGNAFSPAVGTPVTITVSTPVTLTLTKTDSPDPVQAGALLDYALIVTNDVSSKGAAADIIVTDTIPANTTLVNAGFIGPATGFTSTLGSVVTWTLTSPNPLLINQAAALFMQVRVTSPLTNGTIISNDTYSAAASNEIVTVLGLPVVTTTVVSTPTLEISKQGLPAIVQAGGQLTYTIHYTNSGNANATNVVISDTFPISTSYVNDISNPNISPGTPTPEGLLWNIPGVAGAGGGGVITLTLAALAPQATGTVLTNVVSITSNEVSIPTLFTTTNLISSTPNLHISKSADPDPVAVGSILTYTIVYSNDGNADATGVSITDTLDNRVSFNGASDGGVFGGGVVNWTVPSVPADGVDHTLLMSVTVAATLPNNSILFNSVVIVAANSVATDSITTLVQAPTLAVTKVVSPSGVIRAGDTIEYSISYTNTGAITITAPGILITDTFPVSVTNIISSSAEAAFVTASPPELVWSDTDVPPNSGGVIIITGQVITSPWASSGGQISNAVIVAGSGYSATDTVNVQGRPGLPATILLTATPSITQVNNTIQVNATAQDIYGNPVFDSTPITLTNSLAGSQLNGGPSPVVLGTVGGAVSPPLFSTVAGSTTLTAQIAGAGSPLTSTTVATFTPSAVVGFLVQATTPQTAGIAFPITVTAVDAFGNQVTSVNQPITINDTTGTIAPIGITLVNGSATANFTVTQATSPALDTITAISGTITGTVAVEIRPNVASIVSVNVNPTTIQTCGTSNVTTTITDNFGNPIANRPVNLGTIPASGTFAPASGNTNTAGIFNSTFTGTVAGTPSVVAQSTPLFGSTGITITPTIIPTSLTLTVSPNPLTTGGNTALVTATVTDCTGSPAGHVVTFTVSNPALAFFATNPITGVTNAGGVATATLTSNSTPLIGTAVVTATAGNLSQTVNVIVQTLALTITKTANPVSGQAVRPGQLINYTIQVTNTGSGSVSNVVITDVLPAGVAFVSCTSGASCSGGSTTTVTLPSLAAGQSFGADIQVTVTAPTSGTLISNIATAQGSQTSLVSSNIVVHPVTTATIGLFLPLIYKDLVTAPDLIITSLTVSGANPNRVVTVVIQNVGNAPTGEGFWVDFYVNPTSLPNNPALLGDRRWNRLGSTQGIAWDVPPLATGASMTLTSNGSSGLAPAPAQTNWNGSVSSGLNVFAFVDSFSLEQVSFVEINESNENNNLSGPQVTSTAVGEPDNPLDTSAAPVQLPPRKGH